MSAEASERFSAIQSEIYHHGYDRGYKQGRADAEAEHNAMCDTCIHKVSKEDIDQIRKDAIDDVCKQISERVEYWDSCAKAMEKGSNEYKIFISLAKNFDELAEQLKEQK